MGRAEVSLCQPFRIVVIPDQVMPFDKIMEAVKNDVVEAGLLIHEGQLFFPQLGLHRVVDLGIWWQELTGLPLPLGGNAVRRALGPELGRLIAKTIRDSVTYGLEHREEALNYAMQFARDMDPERTSPGGGGSGYRQR